MKEIKVGTENEKDCLVTVRDGKGVNIDVEAKVELTREDIVDVIDECINLYDVDNINITVREFGALDYVIRARTCCALYKFTGKKVKEQVFTREETERDKLRRSRLYVPGNNPRLQINAGIFGSDCIILDLEDSVPPEQKEAARFLVKEALKTLDFEETEVWVRVNREFLEEDIEQVLVGNPHGICLPKSECAEDVKEVERIIEKYEKMYSIKGTKLMPIVESAKGILNLEEIAGASDRIVALAFGAEDFTRDIGGEKSWDTLLYARSKLVTVAKSFDIQALDTVYSRIDDIEGLMEETRRIIKMGFDGKGAIHPEQIRYIHECFTPTEEEIEYAKRVMEAIEEAKKKGLGAISLDGRMIDKPVVKRAERILRLGGVL